MKWDVFEFGVVLYMWAMFPYEYEYLWSVTLGQFVKQCRTTLLESILTSGILYVGVLIYRAIDFSSWHVSESLPVPKSVWFVVGVFAVTWYLRGKSIDIKFPKATVRQWLVFNLLVVVAGAVILLVKDFVKTSDLAFVCLIVGAINALLLYEKLIAIGKENQKATNAAAGSG